ncbi:MAG: magnesium transporter CorA family protein [Acidimicrobiia bacterium]|jgi:magnesium transporter
MIHVYMWRESGVEMVGSDYHVGIPEDPGTWIWVDVVGEEREVVRSIGSTFGLDPGAVEDSFAETNLSLVEEHVHEVFVVLHGFTTGEGERLSTPEIDVFIGRRFLVTIRDGTRASIDAVRDRIKDEGNLPVATPAGMLAFLAHAAGRRYAPLIQELERRIDSLEESAIRGEPQTAVEVYALRRDVILLRRALAPQYDVYDDLSASNHPLIDEEARLTFARVANQHRRALEALEAGRALLGSTLETYRGAVADQTNEIMRILTVFSALLLPLTLIAGIWGMNFVLIPGAGSTWGFWSLVGVMAVIGLGLWIYFARRGFIGAPRVRDLPRAVGLGLFNLGAAPIRAVAGSVWQRGDAGD